MTKALFSQLEETLHCCLRSHDQGFSQWEKTLHTDGLAQDCGNRIANALELPQSCTKPLICFLSLADTLMA